MFVYGTDKEGHPLIIFTARMNDPKDRNVDEMACDLM